MVTSSPAWQRRTPPRLEPHKFGEVIYYSTDQLLARGWTKNKIKNWLTPDLETEVTTTYGTSVGKFYAQETVAVVEQGEEFQSWLNGMASQRNQVATRYLQQALKRVQGLKTEYLDRLQVYLPPGGWPTLLEKAKEQAGNSNETDPQTLKRWVNNYLRHQCSNYECLLKELKGVYGKCFVIQSLREAVWRRAETNLSGRLEDFLGE